MPPRDQSTTLHLNNLFEKETECSNFYIRFNSDHLRSNSLTEDDYFMFRNKTVQ